MAAALRCRKSHSALPLGTRRAQERLVGRARHHRPYPLLRDRAVWEAPGLPGHRQISPQGAKRSRHCQASHESRARQPKANHPGYTRRRENTSGQLPRCLQVKTIALGAAQAPFNEPDDRMQPLEQFF